MADSFYTKEETNKLLMDKQIEIIESIDEKNGSYIVEIFGIEGQGLVYDSLNIKIDSVEEK